MIIRTFENICLHSLIFVSIRHNRVSVSGSPKVSEGLIDFTRGSIYSVRKTKVEGES